MIFTASDKYIRSQKRKSKFSLLAVIALVVALSAMLISSESLTQKSIAALTLLLLIRHLIRAYKTLKTHTSSYLTVEISEPAERIEISNQGTVISIPLSDIEHLRIQRTKGNIKSLLLTTKSFANVRFEGYENLSLMADLLKKYTPEGKVKTSTWYHR
ncbi:hypothetical protein [Pseudomonas sp. 5P_3.1_Bac2]|uniref:hypothetical protein n=1 Tax=Pseudomonas sp. 5P_3.1_Bac2 TaxID=2971617 RepID=UPI0021C63B96|nr:hypothetical protein [Pseudomonas sp. 5P_3.1_Bac2]MCU1715741.1 hypothetical protein [Pseudomonas sp. 5P_3.1_Bac2]